MRAGGRAKCGIAGREGSRLRPSVGTRPCFSGDGTQGRPAWPPCKRQAESRDLPPVGGRALRAWSVLSTRLLVWLRDRGRAPRLTRLAPLRALWPDGSGPGCRWTSPGHRWTRCHPHAPGHCLQTPVREVGVTVAWGRTSEAPSSEPSRGLPSLASLSSCPSPCMPPGVPGAIGRLQDGRGGG